MSHFCCSKCKRFCDETEVVFINEVVVCKKCSESPDKPAHHTGKKGKEESPPKKEFFYPGKITEEKPFFPEIFKAFLYPIREGGIWIVIIGGIFFWVAQLIAAMSLFGLLMTIFISGYFSAYMIKIINSSAFGHTKLPDWPDFMDFFESILRPFFLVFVTSVVSFLPAVLYMFFMIPRGAPPNVFYALIIFGLLYQPMGLLAVAIYNTITALNPLLVLPSILRILAEYIVTCVVLILLIYARQIASIFIVAFVPFVSMPIISILTLYFLAVQMRILGMIYYTSRERLGWV